MAQQERLIRQLLNGETKPTYGSVLLSTNHEQTQLLPLLERRPSISKQATGYSVAAKHADPLKDMKALSISDANPQVVHSAASVKEPILPTVETVKVEATPPTEGEGIVKGIVKTIEEAVKVNQSKETSPVKVAEKKSSASTSFIEGGEKASSNFSSSMSWWGVLCYFSLFILIVLISGITLHRSRRRHRSLCSPLRKRCLRGILLAMTRNYKRIH